MPDALLLEIGGSLKLFGGLKNLRDRIRREARELGFQVLVASAPTPRGALWLSRAGLELVIENPAMLWHRLQSLPLEHLDPPPLALKTLRRMGLRRLGEFARLPRDGVGRRFGPELFARLDCALGNAPDPQIAYEAPETFRAEIALPSPVTEVQALLFAAQRLILQMTGYLRACNNGVMQLRLSLMDEDGEITEAPLSLSIPSRETRHLMNLLRERLSVTPLSGRIESIRLEVVSVASLTPRSLSFLPDLEQSREENAALIEKLRARLGDKAIHGLALHPDARPERAWRKVEPGTSASAEPVPRLLRPAWLLPHPRRLESRNGVPFLDGSLTFLDRTERIASGWWDADPVRRDYRIARNPSGAVFWIFREPGSPDWFLHGIFS
jgi:protein ImuB